MIIPTFFPYMPDEVRELWLEPIAECYGWPFQSLDDSTHDTKWRYVLPKLSLRELADFRWERKDINFATKPLCQESLRTIKGLYDEHVIGRATLYANVAGTKERFRACADFISKHRTMPKPVILRDTGDCYELLDGNHRIAAMLAVGLHEAFDVPAWIAAG